MAVDSYVGTFTKNTVTGNQAITGVGFQPKVIIFFGVKNTAIGFGVDFTQTLGFGVSSTERYAFTAFGPDNDAIGKSLGASNNDACIIFGTGTTKPLVRSDVADFVSLDTDGFTINWTTNAGNSEIIGFIALGGADLTNVKAGSFQHSGSTGNQAVTGVGFQPDIVFFTTEAKDIAYPTGNGKGFNSGVAVSSTQRFAHSIMGARPTRAGEGGGYLSNVNCLFGVKKATQLEYSWDFVSQDTDGFTINCTLTKGSQVLIEYLALKTTNAEVNIKEVIQPTTTGNQATTGVGFKPSVIMGFSGNFTSGTTGSTSRNNLAIWATDGTNEVSQVASSLDNPPTNSINKTHLSTTKIVETITPATTPTLNTDGNIVSFDTDGYTINWTTVDATQRVHQVISIGEAGAGVTTNSFTKLSDARIFKITSFTKTSDSRVKDTNSFSLTSDSLVVVTNSFTEFSDARIFSILSFNLSSDSVIFKIASFTKLSNSRVLIIQSFTKPSDATITDIGSFTKSSDALILVIQSFSKSSDSRIFDILSFNLLSDALISGGTSFTKLSDARVFKVGFFTKPSDSLIILINSFTKPSDSRILKNISFTKPSDSRILVVQSFNKLSDSRIFDILSFNLLSDTLVVSTVSFTKTSDAQVFGSPKINLLSDARILSSKSFTLASDSTIVIIGSFTKSADSQILAIQSFNLISDGRILVVQSFTKTSDSRVKDTNSFTLASDSTIVIVVSFAKTSDSRVLAVISFNKLSDAIIFKAGIQFTLTSDSIITTTGTFSFTLNSDANVIYSLTVKRRTGSIKNKITNITGSIKNRNTNITGKVNKYG